MNPPSTAAASPVDRFFEFSLLGLLTAGYLAVVGSGYLDLITILITAAALLTRSFIAAGLVRLELPSGVVTAITLAYLGFYPVDYFYVSGSFIPAAVHLVFFVAVVKIITATTDRDYLFLKVIAFLELLAACVLSSRLNFFVFLMLFLVLGVATFASGEIRQSRQKRQSVSRISGRGVALRLTGVVLSLSFGILIITAGLFFFLPRTARAAFQHLVSHRFHLAGFSNQVTLGEIGEIKKENTPVMHVKMDHPEDRALSLKWRGSALAQFDGRTWSNPRAPSQMLRPDSGDLLILDDPTPRRSEARRISYAVHLEELASDVLFFGGKPEYLRIDSPVFRNAMDNYRVRFGDSRNVSYQVYSRLDLPKADNDQSGDAGMALPPSVQPQYLQLPRVDSRIVEMTQSIVAGEAVPAVKARLIEKYLRTHFGYTLELPPSEPADPLAFFLLHRKKGHCEYFASSMAVMLRIAGVPSRVVTGFQSGVYNPISGSQLIRTSDAHAWVEAWLPRRGWTTYDPTPPDPNPPRLSLWTRINFYADAAEVFWQDWVLNYNVDRQLQLASRMGQSSRHVSGNWMDRLLVIPAWWAWVSDFSVRYWVVLASLVLVGPLALLFGRNGVRWWKTRQRVLKVQRGQADSSDATLLYLRMLKVLSRRGVAKPPWLTPSEFALVVQEPALSILVADLTAAYNEVRFGGKAEAAGRMVHILERLEAY
jgi:protein-glutamine gamma-glutamyltransferase